MKTGATTADSAIYQETIRLGELHHIHPIGYISMHAGDHDAFGVIRAWIMTDLGWRLADGKLYDRKTFPLLWGALPDRRRGELVEVPDLRAGKVELQPHQMPVHTHSIQTKSSPHTHDFDVAALAPNNGYFVGMESGSWPPRPIGKVQKVRENERGLYVNMQLNTEKYVDAISFIKRDMKRMLDDEISQAIVGPNRARAILGLAPITNKENHMPGTVKLKTPTKNIKRKDLTVAMRLLGLSDQDDLLNAVAIVQELEEGEKLYRAYELQSEKLSAVNIRVVGRDIAGVLTDAQGVYSYDPVRLVVDGKMISVNGNDFVITSPAGEIGKDTLRMVGGN